MKKDYNPLVWEVFFWDGRIPRMAKTGPGKWGIEYHLFDSEQEAKAWLDYNWPGKKVNISQQKWNDWYVKTNPAVFDHRATPVK